MLDKPVLKGEEEYFYGVYNSLEPSRQIGISIAPIPLTEYLAYFQIYGIESVEDRDEILYVVSEMEAEFFDWLGKEQGNKK